MLGRARVDGSRLAGILLSLADDVEAKTTDDTEDDKAEGKRAKDDPGDVPATEARAAALAVDARSARTVSSGSRAAPVRKGAEEGVVGGVEGVAGLGVKVGGKISGELVEVEVELGELGEGEDRLGQVSLELVAGQVPVDHKEDEG